MSHDRPRESRQDPSASTATARTDPSVETRKTSQSAVLCPYCEGTNTEREHPKGPSLCRSIYFCHDCEEPFEAMA